MSNYWIPVRIDELHRQEVHRCSRVLLKCPPASHHLYHLDPLEAQGHPERRVTMSGSI
jgi:hypothetical protein